MWPLGHWASQVLWTWSLALPLASPLHVPQCLKSQASKADISASFQAQGTSPSSHRLVYPWQLPTLGGIVEGPCLPQYLVPLIIWFFSLLLLM